MRIESIAYNFICWIIRRLSYVYGSSLMSPTLLTYFRSWMPWVLREFAEWAVGTFLEVIPILAWPAMIYHWQWCKPQKYIPLNPNSIHPTQTAVTSTEKPLAAPMPPRTESRQEDGEWQWMPCCHSNPSALQTLQKCGSICLYCEGPSPESWREWESERPKVKASLTYGWIGLWWIITISLPTFLNGKERC